MIITQHQKKKEENDTGRDNRTKEDEHSKQSNRIKTRRVTKAKVSITLKKSDVSYNLVMSGMTFVDDPALVGVVDISYYVRKVHDKI